VSRPYSYISAGSSNQDSQLVRSSKTALRAVALFNTAASLRYVKLYDKAAAPVSTDTPVLRFAVPAAGVSVLNLSVSHMDSGVGFESGLGFRITTGAADNDTGAASANDVLLNLAIG
jgi:hypothetical protein